MYAGPSGKAVKAVLEEHGLTSRGAPIRTGLNHVTILKMGDGVVPRSETVVRFACGFGLDVNGVARLQYPRHFGQVTASGRLVQVAIRRSIARGLL